MKILFVNSGLGYGGAETQLIALIRELHRLGHEVALYLLTSWTPRLTELFDLDFPIRIDDKKAKFDRKVLRNLRAFIKEWQPDVVHGFLFDANVYSRVAAVGLGIPVLNSERSSNYKLRASQWLAHLPTRRFASGVVANSYVGADHAKKIFGFSSKRAHVVWNGIDFATLQSKAMSQGADIRRDFFGDEEVFIATLVGAIKYQKDYLLALDVAAELIKRDPRWRVLFVGASLGGPTAYASADSKMSDRYDFQVKSKFDGLQNQDRVIFTGQRDDVARIIKESNVLFTTSIIEGFPNVVLEAMGLSTPVVSTEFSDIRRILPFEWQVIDSRDPIEFADAVCLANERKSLVAQAQRKWAEEHCSISISAQSLLQVYKKYVCTNGNRC
nr:glycosyltransferase [uncultured Roseateles sp.]